MILLKLKCGMWSIKVKAWSIIILITVNNIGRSSMHKKAKNASLKLTNDPTPQVIISVSYYLIMH